MKADLQKKEMELATATKKEPELPIKRFFDMAMKNAVDHITLTITEGLITTKRNAFFDAYYKDQKLRKKHISSVWITENYGRQIMSYYSRLFQFDILKV